MSGTGSNVGTPITALPSASSVSGTDALLVLQVDTSVTPPAIAPRLLPISVLAAALQITSTEFAAALTTALQGLPTALPPTPGLPWNDGGALSVS